MKVTQIKQQLRQTNYYSIFIDGRYGFSLPELKVAELGIKLDQTITTSELNSLKKQSIEEKTYSACLRLIAHRSRSEGELVDYMKRKRLDQDLIDRTIIRLGRVGLVDDLKFSRAWVSNRINLKHSSILQIKTELRKKHISAELISQVLDEAEIDELSLIKILIERKRTIARYQDSQVLMSFLSRRGFSYDKIKQALSQLN
ncbi:MAG TPA: regulatory protein RecX [Candidatus Saccharimonadales bacterium]|nr:regulatory protein RecX [Candidatus Saccharimonadales bacterium]